MSSERLIANELLAFIQHAIDTMDEVSILQICKTNFKEEEICSGKVLLYQTLGKADRMPTRRRDEKGERSLQDIINLLKETDPDDVPAFVARQLHKLPPVTFDHVDVTRLLKEITTLKAGLAEVKLKLEISESYINELRTELLSSKGNDSVSRSPVISNVNTRRGAQNANISSFVSPPSAVAASPTARAPAPAPVPMTSSAPASAPRAYAAAAAVPAASAPAAVPRLQQPAAGGKKQSRSKPARKALPPGPQKAQCDEEGFIKVEKKKKPSSKNLRGSAPTGHDLSLRPAIPSTQLYVSRLHWSTKVEDVVDYVRKRTNFTFRVERLESRHKANFNSFVVRVPTHIFPTCMKEEFWPQGVVFRRFRGRLPADSARNTSPTLRAA